MKKILAIDDVYNNLLLIKSTLNKKLPEYEILLADSGIKGLEIAKKELPETILLDIYMPNMDGYEVCAALKKDESTKNIPILMVSAYGNDAQVRIKGLNAGADAFITKPYHTAELVAHTNVMLRIKKAEDLLRKQNGDLEISISKLQKAEKMQSKNLNQIKKYQKKLKKLNSELIVTEEKERKVIAGYLHDGIGQTLSIAHIKLTSLLNNKLTNKVKKTIQETSTLIDSAITDSRLLTYDLSPPILYELGLIEALKWKLEQVHEKSNTSADFQSDITKINIDTNRRIIVYRIVCELLLNVIKHANASLISIKIRKIRKKYYISIADDGIGFDYVNETKLARTGGYGLFSINERLDSINGSLELKSNHESGTLATLIIPS